VLVEALDVLISELPRAVEMATQEERAAVVTWIRRVATDASWWGAHGGVYAGLADAIESGEHRREETK
jgi:hypothetical protein